MVLSLRRGEVGVVERETAFPLVQPSIVIQRRLLVRGREACRAERREARWTGIWNMMLGKIGSCVESTNIYSDGTVKSNINSDQRRYTQVQYTSDFATAYE